MATGKAAIFAQPNTPMEIQDLPIPDIEPGAILIKVTMANICGSDIHIFKGDQPMQQVPQVIGHEMMGKVEELGKDIKADSNGLPLAKDDRVAYQYFYFCGRCYSCINGDRTGCIRLFRHNVDIGVHPHFSGAFAEYYYLRPNHFVFKVPDELPDEVVSPLNCALSQVLFGWHKLGLTAGDNVLIQGAGGLGLYAVAVAREMGASKIIVTEKRQDRLELAGAFGADHLINIDEYEKEGDRVKMVREVTGGRGCDVAMELTGNPAAVPEGLRMLRVFGKYMIIGSISPSHVANISLGRMVFSNLTIKGIGAYEPWAMPLAMDFLRKNNDKYPFAQIISHKYSLAEINDAIKDTMEGKVTRAAIVP